MKLLSSAILACLLASCAQMKSIQTAAAQQAGKLSNSVAGIMPGHSDIPIVKARPGDMRDLKLGSDQALAFERNRSRGAGSRAWIGGGPANLEPLMPVQPTPLDGDLLPPKVH